MSKIKILVADDIEETRNVIKKFLSLQEDEFQVVGEASNGLEVLNLIPKTKPDLVLMDINMPELNGLEATERITNEFPQVIVVIMSVQAENEYLKKAMFYGAKEYIIKPFNFDNLVSTIKNTYNKYNEKLLKQVLNHGKVYNAKIISFFSSKGGVGKSVLAVNISEVLSREKNKKVLLMDMDLLFGDISMLLNQYNHRTILDIVSENEINNFDDIKPYLYSYSENLDVVFAPLKPEEAENIPKSSIEKLMNIFKSNYDVIIIDTGINFNDNTLYVLDLSDEIMFVSTMEIISLKNTKLGFRVMQSLGYDKSKIKLIINKFNPVFGISKREVEEAFKGNILAMISQDEKTINLSINKGEIFCSKPKYYKDKIGREIQSLCENLEV